MHLKENTLPHVHVIRYHESMTSLPHLFGFIEENVYFPPEKDIVLQVDLRFVTQQENIERYMLGKTRHGDLTVTDWSVIEADGPMMFFLTTDFHSSGNAFLDIDDSPYGSSREYRRWWRNQFKTRHHTSP